MAEHSELLKSMLQDIINDRPDQAQVTMHDYFVSKTREVSGIGQPAAPYEEPSDDEGSEGGLDGSEGGQDDE